MLKKVVGTALMILFFISTSYGVKGPQRLSPLNNSIVQTLDPTFSWKAVTKPGVVYEVKIAEDKEFIVNVIQLKTSFTSLKLSLPYLKTSRSYYWTVRAVYNENQQLVETTWSHENKKNMDHYLFGVMGKATGFVGNEPVIVAPEQNAVLNTLQPEFKWLFPDHAELNYKVKNINNEWVLPKLTNVTYQLIISTKENFPKESSKTFEIKNDSLRFSLSIPWLDRGTKYYWRVKAIYKDPEKEITKESEWSAPVDDSTSPFVFEISAKAKGTFGFNEGQIEEWYDKTKLKNVAIPLISGSNNNFAPSVSKDLQKLAYCSDRLGQKDIFEISLTDKISSSGSGIQKATIKGKSCLNPFWLPGSTEVAFYSNRINEYWRLWSIEKGIAWNPLYNSDMAEEPNKFELYGSCTSDGKIVFTVKDPKGDTYELFLLDTKSSEKTSVLLQGMTPDIGNDDRILYSYCDPTGDPNNFDIMVGNLETNGIINISILTNDTKSDYDPVFSPDGSRIAFTSTRSGNSDIWVMDSEGTNLIQLTSHPLVDRRPQWINNEAIVFQSNRVLNDKNEPVYGIFKMEVPIK